jgi:hypothetical protein
LTAFRYFSTISPKINPVRGGEEVKRVAKKKAKKRK